MAATPARLSRLVWCFALIALLITAVRYYGELQGWDDRFWNRESGGKGSLLGLTWLVPVFGFLFGRALAKNGYRPKSMKRAVVLHFVGLAVAGGGAYAAFSVLTDWVERAYAMNGIAVLGGLFAAFAWGRAYLVNATSAVLCRIPVIVVQYHAVTNNKDSHYAKGPPGAPEDERLFLLTAAQIGFWPFAFSVLVGGLFALLGAATVRRA